MYHGDLVGAGRVLNTLEMLIHMASMHVTPLSFWTPTAFLPCRAQLGTVFLHVQGEMRACGTKYLTCKFPYYPPPKNYKGENMAWPILLLDLNNSASRCWAKGRHSSKLNILKIVFGLFSDLINLSLLIQGSLFSVL